MGPRVSTQEFRIVTVVFCDVVKSTELERELDPQPMQQLLDRYENPSDEQVSFALLGNVCRCSGYVNIFRAVRELAEQRAQVTS